MITFSSDVLNVDIKLLKVLVGFRRTPVPYDLFKQYMYFLSKKIRISKNGQEFEKIRTSEDRGQQLSDIRCNLTGR